jgi:hypothetical protein
MRTMPLTTASRALLTAALSATIAMVGAGCGGTGPSNDTTPPAAPASSNRTTSTDATRTDTPRRTG